MKTRTEQMEDLQNDLAAVVDGDAEALAQHEAILTFADDARDLRHDAEAIADAVSLLGTQYILPEDFEERLMTAMDGETQRASAAVVTQTNTSADDDAIKETVSLLAEPTLDGMASSDALTAERSAANEGERSGTSRGGPRNMVGVFFGGIVLAAAALFGIFVMRPDGPQDADTTRVEVVGWSATVLQVQSTPHGSGLEVRAPGQNAFASLNAGASIVPGSVLRSDARTRAQLQLSDGTTVTINHASELEMVASEPRAIRILEGEVLADVAHLEAGPHAFFRSAHGDVEVLGTKFVVTVSGAQTSVRVMRGVVALHGRDEARVRVHAGEEGTVRTGEAPIAAPATNLARTLSWSELNATREENVAIGIGSLRARRPGEREDRERPLQIAQQDVRVRIAGNIARTEIEQVFRNDSEVTLEGIYRFPLPADAQIASLALDVEGRMEPGAFVERERASRIWRGVIRQATPERARVVREEFIWVPGPWRDPALLEWQQGGQFELRIFPIPAHGERRIRLVYTQTVDPDGQARRYVYPMAHATDDSLKVGEFNMDVRVVGAETLHASGYAMNRSADDATSRLSFSERDFAPNGDLILSYRPEGGLQALRAWAYRGAAAVAPPAQSRSRNEDALVIQRELAEDERPYVSFALRPQLALSASRRARDYVLVVDSSQSMTGERYARASRLAAGVASELDRRDRFMAFTCDLSCRAFEGGMRETSAGRTRELLAWLEAEEAAGASNLIGSLRTILAEAQLRSEQSRELHVIYIGDGMASTGYRTPALMEAAMRDLMVQHRAVISTVAIGSDADASALREIARAGRGHFVPYVPGQRTNAAAMALLETTYGVSLTSAEVSLPEGVVDIFPTVLPTIRHGQEIVISGRMTRPQIDGELVLRGRVDGQPFEQRYPIAAQASEAAGNAFVPRVWAASAIDALERGSELGQVDRIVALSKAYRVMSRHTSLLVLESEAMFRAFRVDRNTRAAPEWTGEEEAVATVASGDGLATGARGHSIDSVLAPSASHAARRSRASRAVRVPRPVRPSSSMATDVVDAWGEGSGVVSSGASPTWSDMPAPGGGPQARPNIAPPRPPVTRRRRRPGRWVRRRLVPVRLARIARTDGPTAAMERAATRAEEALRESPDSRDRHRDAVRRLSRVGQLTRALEVAEAWAARDRHDPEALVYRSDILGRLGHRKQALRVLSGVVDLVPDQARLHERLVEAFDRRERMEQACAHRITLAQIALDELNTSDLRQGRRIRNTHVSRIAEALRCQRGGDHGSAVERMRAQIPEARLSAVEHALSQSSRRRRFSGDFTVDATWEEDVPLDVSIITPQGTRLSWMGGRRTVMAARSEDARREQLGLRRTAVGQYLIEINRTVAGDRVPVHGRLRVRVLGEERVIPFTFSGERQTVARVQVRREFRPEVGGRPGRSRRNLRNPNVR